MKTKRQAWTLIATSNPPDYGYYLASWGKGTSACVSELWYNPTNGWWTSRGYMQAYDGQRNWPHSNVDGVYAWMPMPTPAQQPASKTE
jgi:hypothetical protein